MEDVLKSIEEACEFVKKENEWKEEVKKMRIFDFKEPGRKRIEVNGDGPNSIEISIRNDIEIFESIELDKMETKKLIKSLVMQL